LETLVEVCRNAAGLPSETKSYLIDSGTPLMEIDSGCYPIGMGNNTVYFYAHFVSWVRISESTCQLHYAFEDVTDDE
jgi:hypothetical protein